MRALYRKDRTKVIEPHHIASSYTAANLQTDTDKTSIFEIEDRFVAKCLSFLLDASGITPHPSSCPHKTLGSVPAPLLRDAIRSMMDEFKRSNELAGKDIKYSSLLPQELRDRRVRYCPLVLKQCRTGFSVSGDGKVQVLTVRKPDRNKKELHFVIFSALLQVDPNGICYNNLSALAKEGLGRSGCPRRPGVGCGGPENCRERAANKYCEFFHSSNKALGVGEVYPSMSFLDGSPVPAGMMAVRFSPGSLALRNGLQHGFAIWDKSMISRVTLLDAFGNAVGSAILVLEMLQTNEECVTSEGSADISEAAVVCDISIIDELCADRYCFEEWPRIGMSTVREINGCSFAKTQYIRTLLHFQETIIGFWHNKELRKQG